MSYIAAFIIGLVIDALCTFQHVNSAKNRWAMAFPTSLLISVGMWITMGYAVKDMLLMFVVFSLGGAFGASLGVWYGNRVGRTLPEVSEIDDDDEWEDIWNDPWDEPDEWHDSKPMPEPPPGPRPRGR